MKRARLVTGRGKACRAARSQASALPTKARTTCGAVLVCIRYYQLLYMYEYQTQAGAAAQDAETERYFLGGRDMSFWLVGASLFASNIGSEHFPVPEFIV